MRVECGVRGGVRISWGWFQGMAYPDRVSGRARDGLNLHFTVRICSYQIFTLTEDSEKRNKYTAADLVVGESAVEG